jgi:hypothetical protein
MLALVTLLAGVLDGLFLPHSTSRGTTFLDAAGSSGPPAPLITGIECSWLGPVAYLTKASSAVNHGERLNCYIRDQSGGAGW